MTAADSKKRPQADQDEWLSAAECASRTGLTVRALRVYERQGLITPPRSPSGWRRYGSAELARLNTIVILKALGLTLSQIRAVLAENPPSLLRILDVHAQSWKAKRDMADRALTLVQAARERLRAQESLSVEELCELIRRLETNRSVDMKSAAVLTRELINEMITPEEQQAWYTWWREHPEENAAREAFTKEQEPLMAQARRLFKEGAEPGSPEIQAVVEQHKELLLRHRTREWNRQLVAWDSELTRKWWRVGARLTRLKDDQADAFLKFWASALKASAYGVALSELMHQVREIMKTQSDPASAALDGPVQRIREICAEHGLGDALLLAEFRCFSWEFYGDSSTGDPLNLEWEFMERALRVRQGQSTDPANG